MCYILNLLDALAPPDLCKIMHFPPPLLVTQAGDWAKAKSFSLSATINNAFRRSAAFA